MRLLREEDTNGLSDGCVIALVAAFEDEGVVALELGRGTHDVDSPAQ